MAITAVAASKGKVNASAFDRQRSRIHGDNCRGCIKGMAIRDAPALRPIVSMAITAVAASKEMTEEGDAAVIGARIHGDNCRGCIKGTTTLACA